MKRPTRVPASSVVRMKSASNMIAKWYQSAFSVGAAEHAREDLRHADGEARRAAGAREQRVLADLARQLAERDRLEREAPAADHVGRPARRVVPITAGGELIAK